MKGIFKTKNSYETRTLIRHLPVFLTPANSPAPSPMVPNEPSLSVTLFITESSPFNDFTIASIALELITF